MEVTNEDSTAQHLKDVKLAMEFKYLMKHAPGGVYLMPEFEDIRRLHGVIFLRRGLYRDGIFRFVITLPKSYNAPNTHPDVVFTPPIFNPLIDPLTGRLDLKVDESMQSWQPEKHFIVTALTFIKKIFYCKTFDTYSTPSNESAKRMYDFFHNQSMSNFMCFHNARFDEDKGAFLQRVEIEVRESLKRVHAQQQSACTLLFTEPKPAHDLIRDKILGKIAEAEGVVDAKSDSSGVVVERQDGGMSGRYYDPTNEVRIDALFFFVVRFKTLFDVFMFR